jgi:hypothetical protein
VVPPNRWAYLAGIQGASMTARIARQVRVVSVIGLLLPTLVVGPALFADDGLIPIDRPVVITESGSYVVTADFTATTGSAIKFLGDITVDIDFAGHAVGATDAPVIMLRGQLDSGAPFVKLHDGRVIGVGSGVYSWTNFSSSRRVVVEITKMSFENADVWVEDGALTVMMSSFVHSDVRDEANRGGATGIIENNEVSGGDIAALGVVGGVIRHNVIRGGSIIVAEGDGLGGFDNLVEENTLTGGDIRVGKNWGGGSVSDNLVKRNVVAGAILVANGYEVSIVENRILGCSPSGSGITVTGVSRFGLFERNVLTGACPYGIEFDDLTRGNLYRDNVMPRATCGLVLDNGLDNADGGGNKPTRIFKRCDASTE